MLLSNFFTTFADMQMLPESRPDGGETSCFYLALFDSLDYFDLDLLMNGFYGSCLTSMCHMHWFMP